MQCSFLEKCSLHITEGSLEVKPPTNGPKKSRDGKNQRREEKKKEDKRREIQKKEIPDARKGRKVAKHSVFQWFLALEGRKVGLLKRRVRAIWPNEEWKIACHSNTKHMCKGKAKNTYRRGLRFWMPFSAHLNNIFLFWGALGRGNYHMRKDFQRGNWQVPRRVQHEAWGRAWAAHTSSEWGGKGLGASWFPRVEWEGFGGGSMRTPTTSS